MKVGRHSMKVLPEAGQQATKENITQAANQVTALVIQCLGIIFLLIGSIPVSYAQTITNTTAISFSANPLVYHLSSSILGEHQ